MAFQVRRVITGHDMNGRAVVKIDGVSKHVFASRPGATACNVWTTEGFPASNDGNADEGLRKVHFKQGLNRIVYRLENGWRGMGLSLVICLKSTP